MPNIRRLLGLLGFATALALGACADAGGPDPLAPTESPVFSHAPSATLLECESTKEPTPVSKTIDPLQAATLKVTDAAGGTHEIFFPAGAVATPTTFTLRVPASKYVEVRVTATDPLTGDTLKVKFEDKQPTLAISYKRCTRSNVKNTELHLYNIDESTNAVLDGPFGSKENNLDDPRVKGPVEHFSDYAIGAP